MSFSANEEGMDERILKQQEIKGSSTSFVEKISSGSSSLLKRFSLRNTGADLKSKIEASYLREEEVQPIDEELVLPNQEVVDEEEEETKSDKRRKILLNKSKTFSKAQIKRGVETIELKGSELQVARSDYIWCVLLSIFILLDVFIDSVNLIPFLESSSQEDDNGFNILHGGLFGLGLLSNMSLFFVNATCLLSLKEEMTLGVRVSPGRLRIFNLKSKEKAAGSHLHEFQLSRYTRFLKITPFLVCCILFDDLVALVLVSYRAGFSHVVISERLTECLVIMNAYSSPFQCLDKVLLLALTQMMYSIWFMGYKVAFLREMLSLRYTVQDNLSALKDAIVAHGCELDYFKADEIKRVEINSVVQVRGLLQAYLRHVDKGVGTDLNMLRLSRQVGKTLKGPSKVTKTATKVLEWLEFRNEYSFNVVRRMLFLKNLTWLQIPHMAEIIKYITYVDDVTIDIKKKRVIHYLSFGPGANYDALFDKVESKDLIECVLYVIERVLSIVEYYSKKNGLVLNFCILVDARDEPKCNNQKSIMKLYDTLTTIAGLLKTSPVKPSIILWRPGKVFKEIFSPENCRQQLNVNMFWEKRIHRVETLENLLEWISKKYIPSEIVAKSEEQYNLGYPKWELFKKVNFKKFSHYIKPRMVDLNFYPYVTTEEVILVVKMNKYIRMLFSQTEKQRKRGKEPYEQYIGQLEAEILAINAQMRDHTQERLSSICKRTICDAFDIGIRVQNIPAELQSNIGYLRFVRRKQHGSANSATSIAATAKAAANHHKQQSQKSSSDEKRETEKTSTSELEGMVESTAYMFIITVIQANQRRFFGLNKKIKLEDFSILQLDSGNREGLMMTDCPMIPCLGFDRSRACIYSLLMTSLSVNTDFTDVTFCKRLQKVISRVFEYLSIVVNGLTMNNERLIEIQILLDIKFDKALLSNSNASTLIRERLKKLLESVLFTHGHLVRNTILVLDRSNQLGGIETFSLQIKDEKMTAQKVEKSFFKNMDFVPSILGGQKQCSTADPFGLEETNGLKLSDIIGDACLTKLIKRNYEGSTETSSGGVDDEYDILDEKEYDLYDNLTDRRRMSTTNLKLTSNRF